MESSGDRRWEESCTQAGISVLIFRDETGLFRVVAEVVTYGLTAIQEAF